MKKIIVRRERSEKEMKGSELGKWFSLKSLKGALKSNLNSFSSQITQKNSPWKIIEGRDCSVIDKDTGKVILIIVRKVKNQLQMVDESVKFLGDIATSYPSTNRGPAGGIFDEKLLRKRVPNFKTASITGKFSAFGFTKSGELSKSRRGNPSNSCIIGWTNLRLRTDAQKTGVCRQTALSIKHADELRKLNPFFNSLSKQYQKVARTEHKLQKDAISSLKTDVRVGTSVFSTVTINQNFRTGLHVDKGDFKEGFGVLYVDINKKNAGGELVFPEHNIAVRLGDGDLLLFDPHLYHATCPYSKNAKRTTFVCYLGEKLLTNCK